VLAGERGMLLHHRQHAGYIGRADDVLAGAGPRGPSRY
jgi:hypothetical protein